MIICFVENCKHNDHADPEVDYPVCTKEIIQIEDDLICSDFEE